VDEIEYTIWDGVDATDTGTIRITVNPVNDAPLAYNDAFLHGWAPGTPPPPLTIPVDSLLDNDTDYDVPAGTLGGSGIEVADDDVTGLNGTLVRDDENERFIFEPAGYGWTSFTYTAADGQNVESDPATVFINVLPFLPDPDPDPPPPEFAAVADEYYVGDEPISGNVTDNDIGAADIVILTAPPAWGRMTVFDDDGSFTYTPDVVVAGVHLLGYTAFASDGRIVVGTLTLQEPRVQFLGATLELKAPPAPVRPWRYPTNYAEQQKPGLYVHWNVDNDNRNVEAGNDLLGRPLKDDQGNDFAPKADYKETDAVTNEDDLLAAFAQFKTGTPNKGIVKLTRGNANIRVWSTANKGAANLVLYNNDTKTWNLEVQAERDEFNTLWGTDYASGKLWVEGVPPAGQQGDGKSSLTLSYYEDAAATKLIDSVKINYTLFGAVPKEKVSRQPTPGEWDYYKGFHPGPPHLNSRT